MKSHALRRLQENRLSARWISSESLARICRQGHEEADYLNTFFCYWIESFLWIDLKAIWYLSQRQLENVHIIMECFPKSFHDFQSYQRFSRRDKRSIPTLVWRNIFTWSVVRDIVSFGIFFHVVENLKTSSSAIYWYYSFWLSAF